MTSPAVTVLETATLKDAMELVIPDQRAHEMPIRLTPLRSTHG